MEVLAGVAAVLVPAVAILLDLARPAAERGTSAGSPVRAERAEPPAPPTTSFVQVIAALDTLTASTSAPEPGSTSEPESTPEPTPEPPPEPGPAPEPERAGDPDARHGSAAEARPSVDRSPPASEQRPAAARPAQLVVRGHAPVFAPAATSMPVTVRVVPRPAAAPTPTTSRVSGTRRPESPPAPGSVLGVFSDTEPDRGTAAMRRTTSALVLAAVTLFVATGVAGAIYFGLSRLG